MLRFETGEVTKAVVFQLEITSPTCVSEAMAMVCGVPSAVHVEPFGE